MGKIKLKKFEILLDPNKCTYNLGDFVIGKCVIALEGELELSKIRMEMIGSAKVKWSEDRGRNRDTYSDHFKYPLKNYDFVRHSHNGIISKGIHEFQFSFQLPIRGIPSSFHGFHGSIKYCIEAEIEKLKLFSFNHKTKTEFIVVAPLMSYNLMKPLEGSNKKKVGSLRLEKDKINVDVSVTKSAYFPGEFIPINCSLSNMSTVRVNPRATLKQTQTFEAKGKRKIRETKYIGVEGSPVEPGLTNFETIMVPIPANTELSVECPIIKVSYEVHLTVDIPLAIDLHGELPIVVTHKSVMNKSTDYSGYNSPNSDMLRFRAKQIRQVLMACIIMWGKL